MKEFKRVVKIKELVSQKSVLLLGPRQVGKSTLLRKTFPKARYVDLLEADTFRELSARPESLRESLTSADTHIIVDEIQKLPNLLDEIQSIIDRNKRIRFVLTGSSARKLRRGKVNLLPGRVWYLNLHPLVSPEFDYGQLEQRINIGGLPGVFLSKNQTQELRNYIGGYLQQEIRAEGLVRQIEPFSRFLEVCSLDNGKLLNFTEIGSDAQVPPRTIREYYQLLEDTLIGSQLPPYQKTTKRKPVATSKFYLFDLGIAHTLMRQGLVVPGSSAFGNALEHLIYLELRAYLDYQLRDDPLTFWRTQSQLEVDFVIGDHTAIEVKATGRVSESELKGVRSLSEEVKLKRRIVVSSERISRTTDDKIEIVPIQQFLIALWGGKVF